MAPHHCTQDKTAAGDCHCSCQRCQGCEDKTFFTVKPFDWNIGGSRGSGVSYQVVETRMIATSRCKENADRVAEALNGSRRKEREIRDLKATVECLRSRAPGPSLQDVRRAVIEQYSEFDPLGGVLRWSAHRKALVDFGNGVLRRLGLHGEHIG